MRRLIRVTNRNEDLQTEWMFTIRHLKNSSCQLHGQYILVKKPKRYSGIDIYMILSYKHVSPATLYMFMSAISSSVLKLVYVCKFIMCNACHKYSRFCFYISCLTFTKLFKADHNIYVLTSNDGRTSIIAQIQVI